MMDMATGASGMYVEAALVNAAAAQMATEQYNLICDVHGPATNSIIPDGRAFLRMRGFFCHRSRWSSIHFNRGRRTGHGNNSQLRGIGHLERDCGCRAKGD